MKNASSIAPRGWRHNFVILAIASLISAGHPVWPRPTLWTANHPPLSLRLKRGFDPAWLKVNLKAQPSGQFSDAGFGSGR